MLEKFLEVLTRIAVALENGASASTGSAAPAATETKAAATGKGGRGKAAAAAKDEPSAEECEAALTEMREYIDSKEPKQGIVYARKVMNQAAGVAKMAEIPADKRADVIKMAAAELEAYKQAEDADGDM